VDLMILIAGAAVGLWLVSNSLSDDMSWLVVILGVLGGFSIVGPPILLWARRGHRRRFGPGEIQWFSQGLASWFLWPPVIVARAGGGKFTDTMSGACYFYGTPLMAIYVGLSLLAGGWYRPRRRRRRRYSWREQFGIVLALAWACTGLYMLSMIYRNDFK
jgi:hypothetical protein